MAIISNTYLTFDSVGNREQLADVIYMVDPDDTPLVSMAGKVSASGVLEEWQTDSLAAVDTTNAQLQGNDYTSFTAITPTERVGNYTQILAKTMIVSGTQEAIDKAGRDSDLARETVKRGTELKLDLESILFLNQAGVAGNSTTAPLMATLGAWIKTNDDFGSGGASPSWTSGVPTARTDGTPRAFTETIHKAVLELMWTNGAQQRFLFLGPVNKAKFSSFAGVVTHTFNLNEATMSSIIAAADVYIGEFGSITALPSRLMRERDGWYVDPEFIQLAHLRPFMEEELAKTGDATKRLLLEEVTLKILAEDALGLAADLITT